MIKHIDKAVDYLPLSISSPAFEEGGMIPTKYTCDGKNISPPIDVENVPEAAQCLVLIMDDPDAPAGTWVHWLVWNIPVTHHLEENDVHGVEGLNDFKKNNYGGPCPPSGTHRYRIKIYALNNLLDLPPESMKPQLEKAMAEFVIAFGQLEGLYKRSK